MAVALVFAASPDMSVAEPQTFAQARGCDYVHGSSESYRATTRLLRHHRPVGQGTKRRVQKWATCVATRAKAHAVHQHVRSLWAWRHRYAHRWPIRFNGLPSWDRSWAYSTGACESGNNPGTNTGNGFYGSHQFTLSTARAAGFTRRPDLTSWHEQAVRAVWWMHKTSVSQWPICGT